MFRSLGNSIFWVTLMTLGEIPDTITHLTQDYAMFSEDEEGQFWEQVYMYFLFLLVMFCGFLVLLNLMIAIMATSCVPARPTD